MRINEASHHLPQPQPANDRPVKNAENDSRQRHTDKVEISSDAKRLLAGKVSEAGESARGNKAPELQRPAQSDSVELRNSSDRLARAFIAGGLFADEEKAQQVAASVLEKMSSVQGSESSRLDAIRERVKSGFYGSREVAKVVAEKLLQDIGPSE